MALIKKTAIPTWFIIIYALYSRLLSWLNIYICKVVGIKQFLYTITFCSGFSGFFSLNASKKVYVATSKAAELLRPAPAGTVDTITALNAGTSPKMWAHWLHYIYRISQNKTKLFRIEISQNYLSRMPILLLIVSHRF